MDLHVRHYAEYPIGGLVVTEYGSTEIPARTVQDAVAVLREKVRKVPAFRFFDKAEAPADMAEFFTPKKVNVSGWYHLGGMVVTSKEMLDDITGLTHSERVNLAYSLEQSDALIQKSTGGWTVFDLENDRLLPGLD